MSVKHVKDYFLQITDDYKRMKDTLELLQESTKTMSEDSLKTANANIESIKNMTEKLKENYMRISYIMYLLNKPDNKKKQKKYDRQEQKKLNSIPNNHTLDGIKKENKEIIENLKSYI